MAWFGWSCWEFFSASTTGYLTISSSAEHTFHITWKQTVSLFFDTATEQLMIVSGGGIHNATIHLDSGHHLMRLYINGFYPDPRLLVQSLSPSVRLPLTTINDMVTFVGRMWLTPRKPYNHFHLWNTRDNSSYDVCIVDHIIFCFFSFCCGNLHQFYVWSDQWFSSFYSSDEYVISAQVQLDYQQQASI